MVRNGLLVFVGKKMFTPKLEGNLFILIEPKDNNFLKNLIFFKQKMPKTIHYFVENLNLYTIAAFLFHFSWKIGVKILMIKTFVRIRLSYVIVKLQNRIIHKIHKINKIWKTKKNIEISFKIVYFFNSLYSEMNIINEIFLKIFLRAIRYRFE